MIVTIRPADTIASRQRTALEEDAAAFPRHVFSAIRNDDRQTWCVLEPRHGGRRAAVRFTVCRLDGSIMVLAEYPDGGRRMYGSPDLDEAASWMLAVDRETMPE